MPELQQVADELAPRGVELVTVVASGNFQAARAVAQRVGLRAPILISDGDLQRVYQVTAVPWTVVIGRDGKAVKVLRGGYDGDTFRRVASAYL